MNDPHVVAVRYQVLKSASGDFSKAVLLEYATDRFDLRAHDDTVVFMMRSHCATEEDALSIVQPYVDAWHVSSDLSITPNAFRLKLTNVEIIDRAPSRGASLRVSEMSDRCSIDVCTAMAHHSEFPPLPNGIVISDDVKSMHWQYVGYCEGRLSLTSVAYYLLTVLTDRDGGLKSASKYFTISPDVLRKVGELSTTRGGAEARKAEGRKADLMPTERRWLEEAAKMMVRRAAEVAADPKGPHSQITLADLPPLTISEG